MEMFFEGKWQSTVNKMPVYNPYDGSVIDEVPVAGPEEVERAVLSAQNGAILMEQMPYWKRGEIIAKAAGILLERKEEIAKLITKENGKTIREARAEVVRAAATLMASADEAKRIFGETLPLSAINMSGIENKCGFTFRVPCGIVLAITPFNVPVNLACHKLGPAFAAGNAALLKSASDTPLAAMHLVQSFLDAGLPSEAIQCLTGSGAVLGDLLIPDRRIRKITFTGSYQAGDAICKLAGMKRVTMELGGNCPVIVMADANLDKLIPELIVAGYGSAGQACISTQRVIVHESRYEELIGRLLPKVTALKLGDPMSEDTDMGPLIRERDAKRVEAIVSDAREKGARVLCGGERNGNFVSPAIVADMHEDMRLFREELFGPAVGFMRFTDTEDAFRLANDSNYGLSAGIYTESLNIAMQFIRRVKSGNVMVNSASRWRVDHMPFGGLKDSGLGKEGPRYVIEEMTELRTVIMHLDGRSPF